MSSSPWALIKLCDGTYNNTSIRTNASYKECEIKTSQIQKLPLILELYETITTIKLIIDESLPVWPQLLPHQLQLFREIKTLIIQSQVATQMRADMIPDNIWLLFPNLTELNCYDTYIPPYNLQSLNLSIFNLSYSKLKNKKQTAKIKPRIQEIISAVEQMTTLTYISIETDYPAVIADTLFANNPGLIHVLIKDIVVNNIPSITNCLELQVLTLIIDIQTNPYILELQNLDRLIIYQPPNQQGQIILPDDIFAKPVFTTCKTNFILVGNPVSYQIDKAGPNYIKLADKHYHPH